MRGAVDVVKVSTLEERQIDGFEISGRLRHESDPRPLRRVRDRQMFQLDLLPVCAQSRPIRSNYGVRHPGQFAQARQELIVKTLARIGIFVAGVGQLQRCHRQVRRWDKEIDRETVQQRSDKNAGSGEQHQRQRPREFPQHVCRSLRRQAKRT